MPLVTLDHESLAVSRGLVWRVDIFGSSIAAGGEYLVGLTTGAAELMVFNRRYSAAVSGFTVALYELSWTGGSDPQINNRRLSVTRDKPFTIKTGVTATVAGSPKFSARVRGGTSAGNAQIGFTDPGDVVILKANTSYVVQILNTSAGAGDIDAYFDLRGDEQLLTFSEFGG